MNNSRCLFLLPGVDAQQYSVEKEDIVTALVQEGIASKADEYVVVGCADWVPDLDQAHESARIRDLSRILAYASRLGVELKFSGINPSENFQESYLPSVLRGYYSGGIINADSGLFYTNAKNVSLLSGPVDMTGCARTLIWGPHIALCEGMWSARIYFDITEYRSNRSLEFVWGNLKDSSSFVCKFEQDGKYKIQIDHIWSELDACELKINLPVSTFQGFLNLEKVEIFQN